MNDKNELYVGIDITRDCTLIAVLIMVATTARVYSFQVRDAADHLVNYYLMPIAALKPNLCVGCNRLSRLFINCLGALQAALARGLQHLAVCYGIIGGILQAALARGLQRGGDNNARTV